MIKEAVNRLFRSKIFWGIFSLLAAFFLWNFVVSEQNPVRTYQMLFTIQFEGEEQILERYHLRLSSDTARKVEMQVEGTYSDLAKLEKNPVITVDLSSITQAGQNIPLTFTVQLPVGMSGKPVEVLTAAGRSKSITVDIVEIVSKTVEVHVASNNYSVEDGYVAKEPELLTDTITIDGPEAIVSSISHAEVTLGFSGEKLTKSVTLDEAYNLITNDGGILDNQARSELTLSSNVVIVTIDVNMKKTVALVVDFVYGGGVTEENFSTYVTYSISPESVTLLGDVETLESIDSISLGTVDLSAFDLSTSKIFGIKQPEKTELISGEREATVRVEIAGMVTRVMEGVKNISCINVASGLEATVETNELTLTIRAPVDKINDIEAGNIRVAADMSSYGDATGTQSVKAEVTVDGFPNAGALRIGENRENDITVKVGLRKK